VGSGLSPNHDLRELATTTGEVNGVRAMDEREDRLGRGARGATLVEYALGTALLLVAGLVSFNYLSDVASDEASNQADCISSRPPPPSCVRQPVPAPTTSTPAGPDPTTTTVSPTPTDPPPTTTTTAPPPKATVAGGSASISVNTNGSWRVSAPVTVFGPESTPVAGAVVTARVVIGRQPVLVRCTTDAAGSCALVQDNMPATATTASLAVLGIVSDPGTDPPFPTWELVKP
jgi:hypothetical protein